MNILPPIEKNMRWPAVCCAWCGDDLNVNDNIESWDKRRHFAECQLFLASESGHAWAMTEEGRHWLALTASPTPRPGL